MKIISWRTRPLLLDRHGDLGDKTVAVCITSFTSHCSTALWGGTSGKTMFGECNDKVGVVVFLHVLPQSTYAAVFIVFSFPLFLLTKLEKQIQDVSRWPTGAEWERCDGFSLLQQSGAVFTSHGFLLLHERWVSEFYKVWCHLYLCLIVLLMSLSLPLYHAELYHLLIVNL